MNPRERILRTMRGEKADRVPLVLPGFSYRSRDDLKKINDPLRREIAERIIDETDFKVNIPSHMNRLLVTPPQRITHESKVLPNGKRRTIGKIHTPLGELTYVSDRYPHIGTSWWVKYPVESKEDIKKIASVPWELPEKLSPPNIGNLPDEFSERGIIASGASSPFVCVSAMMKYEWFLELCATDLELIKELTEICRQRILDCVKVVLSKPGIEYFKMGGSEWVTPPMASPMIYDTLVQEQGKSIVDYVHKNSSAVVHIHCHGSVRHALARMIERGVDYTEPVEPPPDGDITMAEAKELAAGRITLGGNVECRVLCNESEDTVEEAVRAAFEGGKERFVLRPSDFPSPVLGEKEYKNYMRMIDVWEELSPIS